MSRLHGLHTAHSIPKGRKIIELLINKQDERPVRNFNEIKLQKHKIKKRKW